MPITGNITLVVSVRETLLVPANHVGAIFDQMRPAYTFVDGTGVGQNDLVWSARITVNANTTDVIDLAHIQLNGVPQSDVFGSAFTFAEVTMIAIRNRQTTPGSRTLNFGPGAANPFLWLFVDASDLVKIVPQGAYCMWSDEAQTVVPTGSDTLRIINTDLGNHVIYDIIIVGRSA